MAMLKTLIVFLALVRAKSLLNTTELLPVTVIPLERKVGRERKFFSLLFNSNPPSSSFLLCLLDLQIAPPCLLQSFCIFYSSLPSAGLTNYLHPLFCAGCKMVITPLSEKWYLSGFYEQIHVCLKILITAKHPHDNVYQKENTFLLQSLNVWPQVIIKLSSDCILRSNWRTYCSAPPPSAMMIYGTFCHYNVQQFSTNTALN